MFTCSKGLPLRFLRGLLARISVVAAFALTFAVVAFAQSATTTTLTISNGGSAATSVQGGTVVTLTATVVAGTTPVTPGQVEFCDASVNYCTDIHLVELGQLTKTGTAVYKFRPSGGNHSYKAIFLGTKTYSGSSSSVSSLDVTGLSPSVTSISASPAGDNWTLTAQVSGGSSSSESLSPTGTVSFLDTSHYYTDQVVATAPLGPAASSLSFSNTYNPTEATVNAVVADFNLDGIPDIITSDTGDNALATYQGNGDGTFKQVATASYAGFGVRGFANGLAVGDFNSDGIPDVVMADGVFPGVGTFLGNGDGSLQAPMWGASLCSALPEGGCGEQYLAVADFNRDGIPDLVVGGGGGGGSYTDVVSLQVLLGNGDGTFGSPITLESITNFLNYFAPAPFPAAGDFNGDGIPDLAVADPNTGNVSIYLGKGDGTFGTPSTLTAGSGPNTLAVADFNKDGILDLAVTNSNSNTVSIFLGNGDGTFTAVPQTPGTGSGPSAITVGDFNGDGIADLAIENQNGNGTILLGNGDGTFTVPASQSSAATRSGSWIASGDLNGDGLTDLVASVSVYLSQYGWTATAQVSNVPIVGVGPNLVAASYPGDANFSPSTSGAITIDPQKVAAITSPAAGSVLSGSSVTFTWSAGSGVTAYKLSVGTTGQGSSNIFASPVLTSTSAAVSGLQTNGSPVYVMLSSEINGVWQAQYYVYTAAEPSGVPTIISPAPGSQLSSSEVDFTWTPGTGVTQYAIYVGTQWPGSFNIFSTNFTGTSLFIAHLPTDGVNVYVTLRYEIGGVWYSNNYTYTAAGSTTPPALTSPTPGSKLSGSTATFSWTPGSGVTGYRLNIGTYGPGYFNVYGSGGITSTSVNVSGLPTNASTLYVTLYYEINGVWNYIFYTYTASGETAPPAMISPAPGSVLPGSTATFTWAPGSSVTSYQLSVGTYAVGYFNTYSSPSLTTTSQTVSVLPTNSKPVYVTLRYEIDGVAHALYYTYTAAPSPYPALVVPTPGTRLSSSSVGFDWSAGVNIAQYVLTVGTGGSAPGNNIIYQQFFSPIDGGTLVSGIPTNGQPVYVELDYLDNFGHAGSASYTYYAAYPTP